MKNKMPKCPVCKSNEQVYKYVYGLLDNLIDLQEQRLVSGGCMYDPTYPTYTCLKCKVSFRKGLFKRIRANSKL